MARGQRGGHARGFFERGSVGHVHDHLKFALVVEGQHLDLDELEVEQRDRPEQQDHDTGQKTPAQGASVQNRSHHPAVEPGDEILPFPVRSRL